MTEKMISAGDAIEARCTKCRKITNHIIVAVVENKPIKVECNTCKGQHKYRSPAPAKKTPTKRSTNPKVTEQKEWLELKPVIENKPAIAYSMTTTFKVGSVMHHPKFGLGLVQSLLGPGKVEVLFEDGKKKMCCR